MRPIMAAARASWFVDGIMTLDELLPLGGEQRAKTERYALQRLEGAKSHIMRHWLRGDADDAKRRAKLCNRP
jgi:hypothetical protein